MHNPIEGLALLVVAEGDRRQCGPVQRAVVGKDVGAERVDELAQPLGPGFNDLACDNVAVDHNPSEITERGGDGRLSGADSAGQANAQHRISLSGRQDDERPDS
jgi:hypothetical protein